jgi:hypothetical protein
MPEPTQSRQRQDEFQTLLLSRLDKLGDEVREELRGIKSTLNEVVAKLQVTETRLGSMEDDRDRIMQEIFTGNGHPSLLTRVTTVERDHAAMGAQLVGAASATAAVRKDLKQLEEEGSKPCLILRRQFDESKRAGRWMLGVGVTIVIGILSLGISIIALILQR